MKETSYAQFLPPAGTDIAEKWDALFYFLLGISLISFVCIIGAAIYFLIKYRRREGVAASSIDGNHKLEFVWTLLPTILVMFIFAWGWLIYDKMISPPDSAYEVKVIGKQWLWQFQYDNGKTTINELYVPVNQPVRLLMTSDDVIHSFFVPDFRIKSDVVPGMYTAVWFEAREPGEHIVYCAEYCGTAHSKMLATVKVLSADDWAAWKAQAKGPKPASLVDYGKLLYQERGCFACHSIDGSKGIAPTLKGVWGTQENLEGGSSVLVDENYVRESIEVPDAKIVKGYANSAKMPPFKGMLTEEELNALIAFIKSLKD